ncbi:hypothetical protein [Streptomyces coffeae]|uniref:Uncharacterized protein n=1 Tax=Streptomyces coffeae TaxID=621382 RepID=A0ABS1NJH7_9ACTN|nr:hypothetical protein [Streptomyces coffeae]MBL1100164.1 hypothetical protein [Streptomyces coffeae]
MEWIDPRYAELVAAMRTAQAEAEDDATEAGRLQGFIVPDSNPGPLPR